MALEAAKKRVIDGLRWPVSKTLLLAVVGITAVISLFEWRLDPWAMLREVVSNFITCALIALATDVLVNAMGVYRLTRQWGRSAALLILLALGGAVGGSLAWGINSALFGVHMSHPWIYIVICSSLAIIFGLAFLSYGTIAEKLDETASRLAEKEVREQRLERLKTQAELEALRARVNPHFLFNTLNSIASLIPVDPARAEDTVQRLSNLFRYILSAGDRGTVPIEEELEIVREYLEIERVRLGDRLRYRVQQGDGLDAVTLPGMLLQPLVENAVKYGVAPVRDGGTIEVGCRREGDECVITITDSGPGFDATTGEDDGFGIRGVRQRLELNYPGAHRFDVVSDGGVTVTIGIPASHGTESDTG